jgi:AraC-like DNA-binding protein
MGVQVKHAAPSKSRSKRHVRLQRIERAVDRYLADCYRKRSAARVKELALFLQVSRPYLSRAVKDVSEVALRAFMRRKQAVHAEALLRFTRLPVHEIAARSAFGDVKTFYRAFMEYYGTRPGVYRKGLPNTHGSKVGRTVSSTSYLRKDGKTS